MKIVEKTYESSNQLFNALSPVGEVGAFLANYICRGLGSEDYQLIPSALRESGQELLKNIAREPKTFAEDYSEIAKNIAFEIDAICSFYIVANSRGLEVPSWVPEFNESRFIYQNFLLYNKALQGEWIPFDLMPHIALAQHYGIPTRLLDWSYDVYVALYFAATNAIKVNKKTGTDGNFVLWLLYNNTLQKAESKTKLKFCTPSYYNNPNLNSQAGTFTTITQYPGVTRNDMSATPLDQYILDTQNGVLEPSDDLPILCKIIIPRCLAHDILLVLQKMHYSAARIFPGFNSILQDLKEKNHIFD